QSSQASWKSNMTVVSSDAPTSLVLALQLLFEVPQYPTEPFRRRGVASSWYAPAFPDRKSRYPYFHVLRGLFCWAQRQTSLQSIVCAPHSQFDTLSPALIRFLFQEPCLDDRAPRKSC